MIIKKIKVFSILVLMLLILTACDAEEEIEGLREGDLIFQANTKGYFGEWDISNYELVKRQTNMEDKQDIAYLSISAELEQAYFENQIFIIESEYYDVGGWEVVSVQSESGIQWIPKAPVVKSNSDKYVIANVEYKEGDDTGQVYYCKYSDYKMAQKAEMICTDLYFDRNELEWIYDFENYNKESVIVEQTVLNDEYITGTWVWNSESSGTFLVEIVCNEGILDVKRIEANNKEFFEWKEIKGLQLQENAGKWYDEKITNAWRLPEIQYRVKKGWDAGEIESVVIKLKPDYEDNVIAMYIGPHRAPLEKVEEN